MHAPSPALRHQNLLLQSAVFAIVALASLPLIAGNLATTVLVFQQLQRQIFMNDFIAFYAAGSLYNQGRLDAVYDIGEMGQAEVASFPNLVYFPDWVIGGATPYRNPPFYTPVVAYFAQFPPSVAYALMFSLGLLAIGGIIVCAGLPAASRAAPLSALAGGALALGYYHFWHGAIYTQLQSLIVALAVTAGFLALRQDRQLLAGLALALVAVKVQYVLPVLVFLLVWRRWDALFAYIVGGVVLATISIAIVGPAGMIKYLIYIIDLARAPAENYGTGYVLMYNWRSLFERLLAPSHPAIIVPLEGIFIALSYGLAVLAWRARGTHPELQFDAGLVLLTVLMVLASPHSHAQDTVVIIAGLAIIAERTWSASTAWPVTASASAVLFAIVWLLPKPDLLGGSVHFGALLLALMLVTTAVGMLRDFSRHYAGVERGPTTPAPALARRASPSSSGTPEVLTQGDAGRPDLTA